jgi:DNA-binding MarR family transcriptional regulator
MPLPDWTLDIEPQDGDERRVDLCALTEHGRRLLAEVA